MTWPSRGDPSSATIGVAERCSQRSVAARGVQPERMEPVGHDEQPGRVPVERPRLVVDRRGEPGRPRPARTLEPELGAAQGVGVGADAGPEVDERSTGLAEGEHGGRLAAAAPAPARAQAARVGDRRVARLGRATRRVDRRPVPSRVPSRRSRRIAARPPSTSAARRSSLIGATVALASVRKRRRRHLEDRGRQPGGGPHGRVAPEVRIHDHADRPLEADRRDAADDEADQLVRLARGRPPDVRLAGDGRQPGEVDPVLTRHEADDRLEALSSDGATNTSDLTIWPSSPPTAAAASSAVWVDSSKVTTSRSRPCAPRRRGRVGRPGGRWGRARPESSIGSVAGPLASAAWRRRTQAIVLADGDVGSARRHRRCAWPGWLAPDAVRRRRGRRRAACRGARAHVSIAGSAMATRSARTVSPPSRPPGSRSSGRQSTRTNPTRSSPSPRR